MEMNNKLAEASMRLQGLIEADLMPGAVPESAPEMEVKLAITAQGEVVEDVYEYGRLVQRMQVL
jgi:hypothetical protein